MSASPIALISVSDREGMGQFSQDLLDEQWQLYATEGTQNAINQLQGQEAVGSFDDYLAQDALYSHLAGKVPREQRALLIAGTLLSSSETAAGLICVNFKKTVQVDVGGVCLLLAGASAQKISVSKPDQYASIASWIHSGQPQGEQYVAGLNATAKAEIARYTGGVY